MSAAFTSLVELCRASQSARVVASDARLVIVSSSVSRTLAEAVVDSTWPTTLFVDGQEAIRPIATIQDGTQFELVVHGVDRSSGVVANNVGSMLRLAQGEYLSQAPANYFLIQEDHASWEAPSHPDVRAYSRALRIVQLLRRLSDAEKARAETGGELIVFGGRKLELPICYDAAALGRTSPDTAIDQFESSVFSDHHVEARRDIAKRVLVRAYSQVPELDRFRSILSNLATLHQSFLADYEVYAAGFSAEKAREEFERRKLDFVVKAGAVTGDVLTKLIAIPVGQALLVSQMKRESGFTVANQALLFGSIAFTVIGAIFVANQVSSLLQIKREVEAEVAVLQRLTPTTYATLRGVITSLRQRIAMHLWVLPIVLSLLLAASTTFSAMVYAEISRAADKYSSVPQTVATKPR